MALSEIFFAVRDKSSASNNALNVDGTDVISFQFVSSGPTGDLLLDQIADSGDADSFPDFDPDTQVIIGGNTYDFSVLLTGTLPTTNPNGAGKVPDALEGKTVMLIKIDINDDGALDAGDPQYIFVLDGSGTLALMSSFGNGAVSLGNVNFTPPPTPVCFCAGTDILTPSGYRKVEALRVGDLVVNDHGEAKPLIWVGFTRVTPAEMHASPNLRPVRIPAGAIGPGSPAADLDVSPQHRLVLEGALVELLFGESQVLVAAKHLLGGPAEALMPEQSVSYYHLLLEEHEILISNGLTTESFQPARRTLDVMSGQNRARLVEALEALGREEMLLRKDVLLSLNRHEGQTLAAAVDAGALGAAKTDAEARAH